MLFDGVTTPQLVIEVAFGGTTTVDPAQGYFVLGASQLGTGQLGNIGWVDVTPDALSLDFGYGLSGEFEAASPGSASIVLDNSDGLYDPLVAAADPNPVYPSSSLFPSATLFPGLGVQASTLDVDVGKPVWVKALWQSTTYPLYRGVIDSIEMDGGMASTVTLSCVDGLETLGRVQLGQSVPLYDGDTAGTRVGRILDLAGWPSSLRSVDTGLSTLQATTFGDSALQLLQAVADTERALLYVDASGKLAFYDRLHVYTATRSTTVQASVTDTGTDVDMMRLEVSKGLAGVFNEARVTRNGGVEQVAFDAPSKADYGTRTFPGQAGTLLRTDADALSMAQWLVAQNRQPRALVSQVEIHAMAQGMWTALLPLTVYDRIRVIRDYGPKTLDVQLLILGIQVSVTDSSWDCTFTTRNVSTFLPFLLGTSQLDTGQLA